MRRGRYEEGRGSTSARGVVTYKILFKVRWLPQSCGRDLLLRLFEKKSTETEYLRVCFADVVGAKANF